jgi:hypothetical protein
MIRFSWRWLLAASPLAVALALLAALAPPPAESGADRTLVLSARADAAARYPGRPALDAGRLTAVPRFDRLPFDELLVDGALPGAWSLDGFRAAGDAGGLARWVRESRWSMADRWPDWRPEAWHDDDPSVRLTCPFRLENGGFGCGRGVQMFPDVVTVVTVGREAWGVTRFTALPRRSHLEVLLPDAPPQLTAQLVPLAPGTAPAVTVRRAGTESVTQCEEVCPLLVPPGEGPVLLRLDGPNPPLGIDLRQP